VLNAIHAFVEDDAEYISSFRTGTVWRLPTLAAAESAELRGPGGLVRSIPVRESRAMFEGERAGFYELIAGNGPARQVSHFAANLSDPEESQIAPGKELMLGERAATRPSGFETSEGPRREVWVYVLALVLAISAIEWFTYHRRVTV
jgi:hypothetical protein